MTATVAVSERQAALCWDIQTTQPTLWLTNTDTVGFTCEARAHDNDNRWENVESLS